MSAEEHAERTKAIWGTGDYAPTSRQLEPASTALVERLGVRAGQRVLDIAAGHGNAARAAARAGAQVVATDFSPPMIAVGRRRTEEEGLAVEWHEADATDLPFDDASFDYAVSVFGAIFAPAQELAASQALRVVRPGGKVGFTAWTPDGYTARMLAITRSYAPPTADAADPLQWGDPARIAELFAPLACEVQVHHQALTLHYDSWDEWRESHEAHGMSVVAKQVMPAEVYEEAHERIRALTEQHAHATGNSGVSYDSEYLEIIVTKL